MSKTSLTIILFLLISRLSANSEVPVKFISVPLNIALTQLSTEWGLPLSFDDRDLSAYTVSIKGDFKSAEEVLLRMTSNLPLRVKKISEVWVISSFKTPQKRDSSSIEKDRLLFLFEGVVMDATNGERLPYSLISWGDKNYYTDRNGYFSIRYFTNNQSAVWDSSSSIDVSFSYLGYNTVFSPIVKGSTNRIFLTPVAYKLQKAVISHYTTGKSFQTGDLPASVRINHAIAKYLPGNGDNSVFNLLRLMPGVRAAGEPSFLSVWGSNEGESIIRMDGYRLFNMNNFNEQISSVNPFMVKEIKLIKGAYPANFGGVTGSIAQVIGVDGNGERPTFKANINNLTANLFTSVPMSRNSVVMASYRQTYYDLYDVNRLNPYGKRPQTNGSGSSKDIFIIPDYLFRDANVRLRSSFGSDNSIVGALYAAQDNFNYDFESGDLSYDAKEANRQYAFSLNLNTKTGVPGRSDLLLFYSSNSSKSDNIKRLRGQNITSYRTENLIGESGAELNHKVELFRGNYINLGISLKYLFDEINQADEKAPLYSFYIIDNIVLNKFEATIGLRVDSFFGKSYYQPRVSATVTPVSGLKVNAAYGTYYQYTGRIPYIDYDGNFSYIWKLFSTSTTPVIISEHITFGTNYSKDGWYAEALLYKREIEGVLRFSKYRGNIRISDTKSYFRGVDIMINREYKGSNLFLSASLSSAEEVIKGTDPSSFKYNPYEIKAGTLINLSPFFISASYVNGSGYRNQYAGITGESEQGDTYSRFDIAFNYRYSGKRFQMTAGLSVLNLFNNSNSKYIDVIPSNQGGQSGYLNTYIQAVPFTPVVSVEINL